MDLKLLIEQAMKKEGIDLIGFAGKDRFEGVDAQHNPFSIFPEGKTVIMLGKRICRGALRGVEEGTNFGDYALFGKNWLEDDFLSLACYNLVRVLEDEGWEAVPLFPNPAELGPQGVSVAEGRPAPNVYPDFDYAAVACGIAEIGFSGVLLTPKFGSRQRFQMILTDAEIEASPLLEQSVCDRCGKCADVCPMGAI
ncbi:MAG: 4Fe-4S binding protein, partial [Clostridia bacterium]|nr:4Fe-4S binding protein [Clostridia bacterium]